MSTATELRPSSLAERIAKVRNRMLVATLTKVPPSNKELFVAVCQIYEQRSIESSSFSRDLFDDLPLLLQESSFTSETEENTGQQWPECVQVKTFSQRRVEDFKGHNDDEGPDWYKAR